MKNEFTSRLLINGTSAILLAFLIIIAELAPFRWIFSAAVAAIAAIAVWEFTQLVKKKGLRPALGISITAAILYVFAVFFKTQGPHAFWNSLWQNGPEVVLGLAFFACFAYYTFSGNSPITHISTAFLGIVYIAIPFGLFLRIVYFFLYGGQTDPYFEGSWWLLYTLAVTKSADMGGYFVGKGVGRRKLALKVSPNKTLEGAIGGILASAGVSLIICYLGRKFGHVFAPFGYLQALFLGGAIGVVGQLGDLAESLLKRDAGVKDSNTIPGVGGVLDMVDSLLFTAPVVYIFLRILYT